MVWWKKDSRGGGRKVAACRGLSWLRLSPQAPPCYCYLTSCSCCPTRAQIHLICLLSSLWRPDACVPTMALVLKSSSPLWWCLAEGPRDLICTLIRREVGKRALALCRMKTQQEVSCQQAKVWTLTRTQLCWPPILNFQPSDPWRITLWFKSPSLLCCGR